VIETDITNI